MKKALLAAIAIMGLHTSANAADYYSAAPSLKDVPPVVVVTNNWTGAYVGGFVGGSYDEQTIKEVTSIFTADVVKGLSNTSVLFGAYGGYDYEMSTGGISGFVPSGIVVGAWVEGAFAEGGSSNILDALHFKENNTFSTGVRLGYAVFPSFMPYVTGGFTMADYDVSFPGFIGPVPGAGNLHNLTGGTVGAGVEFQISNNMFAKVEYRHDMYDTKNIMDLSVPGFLDVLRDNLNANRVMLGIHYKFNNSTGGLLSARDPRYASYK